MFLLVVLVGCGSADTPAERQSTEAQPERPTTPLTPVLAKAHLADAATEARKWRQDAVIVQIFGRRVPDDGKVSWWDYAAWSPSTKGCLGIQFIRGNVNAQETRAEACQYEPLGEIIDSDQAIRIARANGITRQDVSMFAMPSPTRKGTSVWSVVEEGMRNPGNVTLDIDGVTGKVLNTTRTP
jgi:hypothetical protein